MNGDWMRLAVVGHTNTGKTSLLRTLTRDADFGEVSARPATTREVQSARLLVEGRVLVELFDTPGLEDPIALLEWLDDAAGERRRSDGVERVRQFLASPLAAGRFQQEAKVLAQLLRSDAALYVIDSRDPVLAKHRDELQLLALCATPVLPVLNFLRDPAARPSGWNEVLGRAGLHAQVRFDSVAPERAAERQLYQALALMLPSFAEPLQQLLAARQLAAEQQRRAGWRLIAEALVELAVLRVRPPGADQGARAMALQQLQQRAREREQRLVDDLLGLYRFNRGSVDNQELPLRGGRWGVDLFDPAAARLFAARLGGGAAAGAAAGVAVDLAFAGITLGAAALTGALLGGGVQTARRYGRRLWGQWRGQPELRLDPDSLTLLLCRADYLLRALEARGHGAVAPIPPGSSSLALPPLLRAVAERPEWSERPDSPERERAVAELGEQLAVAHAAVGAN